MSGAADRGRRGVLAGISVLALTACAGPARLAQGGGEEEPRGGIGGTGIAPDQSGGAPVGVVGTLTGFGSLRVNGVALETGARMALSPIGPIALAPGHVLAARAARENGALALRSVAAVIALAGPVTRGPDRGRMEVAGVEVRLEPGAPLPAGGAAVGARVAVSGLWRGDVLVASRVDPLPDEAQDVIAGVLRREGGALRLGGLAVAEAAGEVGDYATWTGRWTAAGGFAVQTARIGRPLFGPGLGQLSAEGYLERDAAGGYAISGLGVTLDPGGRIGRLAAGRAVFIGRFEAGAGDGASGRFRVEHGIPLPEGAEPRAVALGRIGDGLAPTSGAVETR